MISPPASTSNCCNNEWTDKQRWADAKMHRTTERALFEQDNYSQLFKSSGTFKIFLKTKHASIFIFLVSSFSLLSSFSINQRTLAAISKMQVNGKLEDYNRDFMENRKLKKYVEECCKYAWNLVCQTPPYEIEGNLSFGKQNKKVFDPSKHVCPYSNQDSSIIHAVTWPSLVGPSKRVIRKAEVLLEEAPAKSSRASMH